jgi:guanylate kinase
MAGKLLIFCAPSGSGKSTIVGHLMQLDLGLAFSISATSRLPRKGEKDGREYHFITADQFRQKIGRNEFVEWEEVYPGQYYGTPQSELDRIWKEGKHAIFDIDVAGGMNLKKKFGHRALSVFVRPPSLEVLEQRLRDRGTDDEESLRTRLGKASREMAYAPGFDVILLNDDLGKVLKEAEVVVRNFISGP